MYNEKLTPREIQMVSCMRQLRNRPLLVRLFDGFWQGLVFKQDWNDTSIIFMIGMAVGNSISFILFCSTLIFILYLILN